MINLPPDAIPFLRQQRTEYARHSEEEARAGFASDVREFAERLKPLVPAKKPDMRFLDIGCGLGFGLLALRTIYGPDHRFVGIDRGIPSSQVLYGFSKTPSAYNSLDNTLEILIAAGVAAENVRCVDIDTEPFPTGKADVIISTYAWGFHFPVETYLDEAEATLAADGVIVLDVRGGLGQEALLKSRFDIVHVCPALHGKSDQLILKHKSR